MTKTPSLFFIGLAFVWMGFVTFTTLIEPSVEMVLAAGASYFVGIKVCMWQIGLARRTSVDSLWGN